MKLTKQQEIKAMRAYNAYWDNYLKGDVEAMASLLSNKYTQVGSAETEVFFNKKDAVKFLYDTIDQVAAKLEMRNRSIKLEKQNNFLLFHELCDLYALAECEWIFYSKFRATTIMEEKRQGWKIIHQHSSFPDARTGEGENIAIDKLAEENRELREAVKRRTVELEHKSRELEIEASLERVRSIAMGMREPADMLDVCKTISIQLQLLGVKEIRNVQTAIFYEQRGTYMNYEFYANHDKTIITETVFTNNEIHNEFATKMLRGKGETFITHIKGDEVKDWIAYQKTTNVFIDKYLETASSLNYYWFSLGPVALGISTYYPLTEAEITLFQRFLKVFELAYQRYLDIEQAETQAREAQIEASLERVRAVAMGMNKSDDLLSICEISFKEFKKLGFDNIRNSLIHIQYDNQKYFMDYDFSDLTGGAITKIEYGSHPVVEDYLKQIRSAEDAFYQGVIKEDQLEEWKDFRRNSGQIDDPRLDKATALYYYFFSIGIGDIGISTLKSIDESQIKILKRFRNVFDLTYRRYNDITQAEAQAREAQIEAALERVRSRTMGMQKSEELKDVIRVVYEQFVQLKINVDHAGFVVDYTPKGDWHFWIADEQDIPSKITHPYFGSVWANQFNEAKEKGMDFFATNLNFEEKNKFYNELLSYVPGLPEASKDFYLSCPGLAATTVLFDNVSLYIENFSGIPYSDEENKILMRFGKVFQQTYTRFLDLQKAEAQTREAQIESSLERVRSKAMAMHSPNDLSETVNVFFKELKTLGIIPIRCGVGQIDDATRTTSLTTTTSSQQGESFQVIGKVKQTGHPVLDGIFDHWKLQKEYHPVVEGEDIKAYYNVMNAQIGYPEYPEEATQYGNNFFFKEGFVFAWTENLLSEEELIIFRRFTSVLSLTYRRYLDLKEAEERNKIIQADNERKTKELEEARQLQLSMLPKKLPQLPNLDIAVYMKTATEVGGDYYDFNVQANGVLNIGFGDATGHGLQAGTMITLMKGFFTSDAARFSPQKFLENCNSLIRDIKLGRILMSFSHLRFENNSLLMSSAGMPPVYYHHKINNRTEEIIIQGLPLGALQSTSYKLVEKKLNAGDTILLLTDGLPEQMNSQKVIFDYSRVLKYFDEIADNPPQEIINRLVQKADGWMNGQQQTDDITFVVIKVK
jgi:ketosteroid isomerase-like protein